MSDETERNGLKMKYFVLKPAGDDIYAQASRAAMFAYATLIAKKDETLARDLNKWATDEALKVMLPGKGASD